jgi:hypothetical protein
MSATEPYVRIGLGQIYDKLCAVERDVADLKAAEAVRSSATKDRYRHKMLLYPTCATAAAGLATAIVSLVR